MVMSSDLTNKMTRHAQRLIALAPKNPASFEMLSYVQMKNTDTLPDAAKYALYPSSMLGIWLTRCLICMGF